MGQRLGILVNSEQYLDYVLELTKAAHAKGKDVKIFLIGKGASLIQSTRLNSVTHQAEISVCSECAEDMNFSQDMLYACDRYVVL